MSAEQIKTVMEFTGCTAAQAEDGLVYAKNKL